VPLFVVPLESPTHLPVRKMLSLGNGEFPLSTIDYRLASDG